jgi:hypothetical protein
VIGAGASVATGGLENSGVNFLQAARGSVTSVMPVATSINHKLHEFDNPLLDIANALKGVCGARTFSRKGVLSYRSIRRSA